MSAPQSTPQPAAGHERRALVDGGLPHGLRDGALHRAFMQVVPAQLAGGFVEVAAGGGEEVLPLPGARGRGVLPRQRVRQVNRAVAARKVSIGLVLQRCRVNEARRSTLCIGKSYILDDAPG